MVEYHSIIRVNVESFITLSYLQNWRNYAALAAEKSSKIVSTIANTFWVEINA